MAVSFVKDAKKAILCHNFSSEVSEIFVQNLFIYLLHIFLESALALGTKPVVHSIILIYSSTSTKLSHRSF